MIGRMSGMITVALAFAAPAAAQQRCPAPPTPQSMMERLPAPMALADRYIKERMAPGIVIAWGCGDVNPTIIAAGSVAAEAGAADVTADTLWRVYSMTKPITGMAAMLLIEDGKLRLDQPIAEIIPAFKNMKVLTDPASGLASRPAKTPITVRHLLTHTAGLGYSIVTKGPLLKEYERLGILPGAVNAQMEAQMAAVRPKSLVEFANRTASLPLIAEPGTEWSYSIGLDVLGAVIEVASGMPFERFVKTRLLDPLGMASTYWTVPASEVGRLASNYAFVGDNLVPFDPAATSVYLQPPSFAYGGAGLVMSAKDYDRFLHMLANGGELDGTRVMKAETVATAMSDLLPAGVTFGGVDAGTGGTKGPKMGFGAGGSVYLEDVPGGPGAGTYGWGGAAGTIAWVDPKHGVRGTAMVNYFPADKWPLRADVTNAVYSELQQ
ncbi:serine hydrolase domain-containing protein [Sphingomonas japonica]